MKKLLHQKHHHYHVLAITLFVALISLVLASTSFIEPTEKIFFETSVTGQVITGMATDETIVGEGVDAGSPTDLLEPDQIIGGTKPKPTNQAGAEYQFPDSFDLPEEITQDDSPDMEGVRVGSPMDILDFDEPLGEVIPKLSYGDIAPELQGDVDTTQPKEEEPGFLERTWNWIKELFSSAPAQQTNYAKLPQIKIEPFEIEEGEEQCMLTLPSDTVSTTNTLTGASIKLTGREVSDIDCLNKRQALIQALADLKGAMENHNQAVRSLQQAQSNLAGAQAAYENTGEQSKRFMENKMLDAQDAAKEAEQNYQQAKSDLEPYKKTAQEILDDFIKSGCDKDSDGDGAKDALELLQGTNPDKDERRCCICLKSQEGMSQTAPGQTRVERGNILGLGDVQPMAERQAIDECRKACKGTGAEIFQLTGLGTTCGRLLEQLKPQLEVCPKQEEQPAQDTAPQPPTEQSYTPPKQEKEVVWKEIGHKKGPRGEEQIIEDTIPQGNGQLLPPSVSVQQARMTPQQICEATLKGSIPVGMDGNDVVCGCPEGQSQINGECATTNCNTICTSKGLTEIKPDQNKLIMQTIGSTKCRNILSITPMSTKQVGSCACYESYTPQIQWGNDIFCSNCCTTGGPDCRATLPGGVRCSDENPGPADGRVACDSQEKSYSCPTNPMTGRKIIECISGCRWGGYKLTEQGIQINIEASPGSQEDQAPQASTTGTEGNFGDGSTGTGSQGGVVIPG